MFIGEQKMPLLNPINIHHTLAPREEV